MKITRDSLLWMLGIAGAFVLYLGNTNPPIHWTWAQWMQFLAMAISTLSAKLSTSPLKGAEEPAVDLTKVGKLLIVAILGSSLISCATARHRAVQTDVTLAKVVFAIDDAERAACSQKVLSADQCAKLDPVILKSLKDVRAATLILQATPKAVVVPQSLTDVITDIATLQNMIAPLNNNSLAQKVNAALTTAADLLRSFGGK